MLSGTALAKQATRLRLKVLSARKYINQIEYGKNYLIGQIN